MLIRDLVFKIISDERDSQNHIYGANEGSPTFDELNTLGDWVQYIEAYLKLAKSKFCAGGLKTPPPNNVYRYNPERARDIHRAEILQDLSKVAALCVATLEQLGEPTDFNIDIGNCNES